MSREEFCYEVVKEVAHKCEEKGGFLMSRQVVSAVEVLASHIYDVMLSNQQQEEDIYKSMWNFLYKNLDRRHQYYVNVPLLLELMERIERDYLKAWEDRS